MKLNRVAILGTYVPRQCGIATFTADVARSLNSADAELGVDLIAMDDRDDYSYSDNVRHRIPEKDAAAYSSAAEFLNRGRYDVLSIQHEYGIFGGDSGSHLLSLIREARMPIVTTLHTVLRDPSPSQKAVMDELLELSERVVVMSEKAIEFLEEVHGLDGRKVDLIPHGIPKIEPRHGVDLRRELNIEGPMILTFGLLSPDKGVQYVIEAMPQIVARHPGAAYVVVGATHPNIRASAAGETYRESLVRRAEELGVAENVRFVDRFVTIDELVAYLSAMDIYVTPYLNPKQITSGTLAYAVGAGKAVISTPYWYAEEMLADGRGKLVPFRDPQAIADAVIEIQDSPEVRAEMGRKAAEFGKQMLWPEVGKKYLESFTKAKMESADRLRRFIQKPADPVAPSLSTLSLGSVASSLKLDHLFVLSDDTGILQHSTFSIPNRLEGYCVDDNSRALILTGLIENTRELTPAESLLQSQYLSFVLAAYNEERGRFRNFMSYDRKWLEEIGSEDCHGRAMWSLGVAANRCKMPGRRDLAKVLFEQGIEALHSTTSPRTWAYAVLGATEYLSAFPNEYAARALRQRLADKLMHMYHTVRTEDWRWFEDKLTYANARISHSLIVAGESLNNQPMLEAGVESLTWLMEQQTSNRGCFAPIGSNGFYKRGEFPARFDQQPIEAASAVSACLAASQATNNPVWIQEAQKAYRWFLGDNQLGLPLYDPMTGGCHDGLHEDRVNRNQGAESTLAFLSASIEIQVASVRSHAMAI